MSYYRKSWEFQVTVTLPCPMCGQFKTEKEITKRERYVYPLGWLTHESGCQECFDKAFKEHQVSADKKMKENLDMYGY